MAVPKRRKSSSKRDMRRSQHDKVTATQYVSCSHCGDVVLPHRVCAACGWYKGRAVIAVKGAVEAAGADSAT